MNKNFKIGIVVLIVVILFGINFLKNSPELVTDTSDPNSVNFDMTYEEAVENDLPTMLEFRTVT